jgi:hypothetical protein
MTESEETRCAECGTRLAGDADRVVTDGGTFCRACFDALRAQLDRAERAQSEDVPVPAALAGGLAGAAVGAGIWWGFTVMTGISFGLVAIVIGYAVGKGVLLGSGGKRSVQLQGLSAGVAGVAYFYATYLVNRSFYHRALGEDAGGLQLPLVPGPALFVEVVRVGLNAFDLIFLAIVLWEAWRLPAPFRIRKRA